MPGGRSVRPDARSTRTTPRVKAAAAVVLVALGGLVLVDRWAGRPGPSSLDERLSVAGIDLRALPLPAGWRPASDLDGQAGSVELAVEGLPRDAVAVMVVPRTVASTRGEILRAPRDVAQWVARQPGVTVDASTIRRREGRRVVVMRYLVRGGVRPSVCPHPPERPGCRPSATEDGATRLLVSVQDDGLRWVLEASLDDPATTAALDELVGVILRS